MFDKAQNTLLAYPIGSSRVSYAIPASVTVVASCAFSYAGSLSSVEIPSSVTEIAASAFFKCTALTDVYYSGGTADWNEIAIGSGNDPLNNASKHYNHNNNTACGDNLVWTLVNGTLSISGTGDMYDYGFGDRTPWASYREDIHTVNIGYGVTRIGVYAFQYFSALTDVTIPSTVNSIGYAAFGDCTALTSLTVPEGVTIIAEWAFSVCSSLTEIYIPSTLTNIGYGAFSYCTALTDVYYSGGTADWNEIAIGSGNDPLNNALIRYYRSPNPSCGDNLTWILTDDGTLVISGTGEMTNWNSVRSVPWDSYCDSIQNVILESGVTSIGNYAFYYCDSLTAVTIPDSVTSVGNYAFYYCDSLTAVTIPDSVTSIGDSAFQNCTSLTSMTIPSGVESIGVHAFYGCDQLARVTIPDSVTSVGDRAFYGCSSLFTVTIPDSVTSIGNYAFACCVSLTAITVDVNNANYSSLDGVLFSKDRKTLICCPCGKTESCTIPSSVESIGDLAFYCCVSLTAITVDVNNASYSSMDGVLFSKDQKTLVCYPGGKTGAYAVPDSVTSIGDRAFEYCTSLTSVTIPDSVIWIGEWAFFGCSSLTSVTIPDSVIWIGEWAFCYCDSLTSVTIPDSVTSIGDYAFFCCSSLTDVYYTGTEADWNAISIGSENSALTGASIHYNTRLITVESSANGTVEVDKALAFDGDTVTVTATPNENCSLVKILVDGAEITGNTFTVTGNHTVSAEFAAGVSDSGTCGVNLTWVLTDDGTLTINGTVHSDLGDQDVTILAAAYDASGKMLNCSVKPLRLEATDTALSLQLSGCADAESLKIFCMTSRFAPLIPCVVSSVT